MPGRSGGDFFPGVSAAHMGHHRQIRRTGPGVPPGEVPAGPRHVFIDLHDRGDDSRQIPSCLQPDGQVPAGAHKTEHPCVRGVGDFTAGQPAAGFHLLTGRGGARCV